MVVEPLPPRTRGRHALFGGVGEPGASTPAHAGPTTSPAAGRGRRALYPRARGADGAGRLPVHHGQPLPPRTRGRHLQGHPRVRRVASTPAHAGPTRRGRSTSCPSSLYPRARGADGAPGEDGQAHPASTPAHAGPTIHGADILSTRRLYPRARGADSATSPSTCSPPPLPPRTRGRPRPRRRHHRRRASTPAHAGPTPGPK